MQIIAAKLDADLQREAAQSEYAVAEETVGHRNRMREIEEQNDSSEGDIAEDAAEAETENEPEDDMED